MSILLALSLAPLSSDAPRRESAIVLASDWGALRLGERSTDASRSPGSGAAAVIVLRAVLLGLGG